MDLQFQRTYTHVLYSMVTQPFFASFVNSVTSSFFPFSSVLPPLISQGDTGSTQGQVQVEGVPQHPVEGAVGGGEGGVSLEAAVGQLTHSLRGLLDQLRVVLERPVDDDNEREQDSDDDDR